MNQSVWFCVLFKICFQSFGITSEIFFSFLNNARSLKIINHFQARCISGGNKYLHCLWQGVTEVDVCNIDLSDFWNFTELSEIHCHWAVAPVDSHHIAPAFLSRPANSIIIISTKHSYRRSLVWTTLRQLQKLQGPYGLDILLFNVEPQNWISRT